MQHNVNNKERMNKIEIAKILEWHNSGTLNTDEAVERICSLFSVVGRSEQLKCDCCNGSGMVEGEHYDDLQSCNTCLGRGTF